MTPSYLSRSDGSKNVFDDIGRSMSKYDHRSGQARSRSGHDPGREICVSPEVE